MVDQVAMRSLPADWSVTPYCTCYEPYSENDDDAICMEHDSTLTDEPVDHFNNPSVALADTFDSFTPATLGEMVAQQEEPLIVSAVRCAVGVTFR